MKNYFWVVDVRQGPRCLILILDKRWEGNVKFSCLIWVVVKIMVPFGYPKYKVPYDIRAQKGTMVLTTTHIFGLVKKVSGFFGGLFLEESLRCVNLLQEERSETESLCKITSGLGIQIARAWGSGLGVQVANRFRGFFFPSIFVTKIDIVHFSCITTHSGLSWSAQNRFGAHVVS